MRILNLSSLRAAAGRGQRRVALGAARRSQRSRAAPRRELGPHRQRRLAGARRLRPLLRLRDAHRKLRALLQSAVLARCTCSFQARSRSRWRILSRPGATSRRVPRSTRSTPTCGRPIRSRRSVGLEGVVAETTMAVRYVTSYGRNLVRKRNLNQALPGPGSIDSRRPLPGARRCPARRIDGLVSLPRARAERRRGARARGASFRAAYTLAKSEDDTSAFLATDGDDNTPQDSRNLAAEWGPSDFDVRQRLVLTAQWAGPRALGLAHRAQLAGERRVLRAVGPPVYAAGQRGQQQHGQRRRRHLRLRPSERRRRHAAGRHAPVTYGGQAFVIAPRYTFGNAGRNSLVGPAYAALDGMVSRSVPLGERRTVDAAHRDLQRPEPQELSASRQLRGSRDVRSRPCGVPAAAGAARRAIRILNTRGFAPRLPDTLSRAPLRRRAPFARSRERVQARATACRAGCGMCAKETA